MGSSAQPATHASSNADNKADARRKSEDYARAHARRAGRRSAHCGAGSRMGRQPAAAARPRTQAGAARMGASHVPHTRAAVARDPSNPWGRPARPATKRQPPTLSGSTASNNAAQTLEGGPPAWDNAAPGPRRGMSPRHGARRHCRGGLADAPTRRRQAHAPQATSRSSLLPGRTNPIAVHQRPRRRVT